MSEEILASKVDLAVCFSTRESNMVAHSLACHALHERDVLIWLEEGPEWLVQCTNVVCVSCLDLNKVS